VIRLEPKEEIRIGFLAKKTGFTSVLEPRELNFLLREHGAVTQYTEEYERLLLDCICGDQTLFVSEREVEAMWRYVDPIIRVWHEGTEKVPLHFYTPDTREVLEQITL
jgi:glucose-6-phosphate 1-dehydrogenase